jgi:hypothetical protein
MESGGKGVAFSGWATYLDDPLDAEIGEEGGVGASSSTGLQVVNRPTELDTTSTQHVKVRTDKLTVAYVGPAHHTHDVGTVRGNKPIPKDKPIYYFEVEVLDAGKSGCITIGVIPAEALLCRQPGSQQNSFGYRGDEGRIYEGSARGKPYGPQFSTHDIVGCGVDLCKQQIFYTLNGKHLGVAHKTLQLADYAHWPAVAMHSQGELVEVNFGQDADKPFAFDVESMIEAEMERHHKEVELLDIPAGRVHGLIRSYLVHHGYQGTLAAFENATARDASADTNSMQDELMTEVGGSEGCSSSSSSSSNFSSSSSSSSSSSGGP